MVFLSGRAALSDTVHLRTEQCRIATRPPVVLTVKVRSRAKPLEVVWSPRLWSRSRKPLPAKRLHAHHGADLVAIDVGVSRMNLRANKGCRFLDPAMNAEGQSVRSPVALIAAQTSPSRSPA